MNIYFILVIVFLSTIYLIQLYLNVINLKAIKKDIPTDFKDIIDQAKYQKSQEYLKDKTKYEIFHDTVTTIIILSLISTGIFNIIDKISLTYSYNNEILRGIIFFSIIYLGSFIINIPFKVYYTFGLEEKYGFNKTTVFTFIIDIFKTIILSLFLFSIALAIILTILSKNNESAWLVAWLSLQAFEVFILFISPITILPLFNKFTPLKDKELSQKIINYTKQVNYKVKGIFSIDGSKRSSKGNAYFTGFGPFKKIALFDTLIDLLSHDEILAVLAHEIGHNKKKHVLKHFIFSFLQTGLMFYFLSLFLKDPNVFLAFKMDQISIHAGLFFFFILISPINFLFSIVSNIFSRKYEYEADKFAYKTTHTSKHLINGLKKLSVDSLTNLTPHPHYVFTYYSHPPLIERINHLQGLEQGIIK